MKQTRFMNNDEVKLSEKVMALDFISGNNFSDRFRDLTSWSYTDYENRIMQIHPSEMGNVLHGKLTPFYQEKPSIIYPGGVMKNGQPIIEYKFNSSGFRSDDFNNKNNESKAVFLGCSITEGVGGKLDNIWANRVYKRLLKDKKISSGFYNLGMSGAGIQTSLIHFMKYVSAYGAPKYLFALFPSTSRQYLWEEKAFNWRWNTTINLRPHNWWTSTSDDAPANNTIEKVLEYQAKYAYYLASAASSLYVLEEYCKQIGTSLLWHTWATGEAESFEAFDNFISYPEIGIPQDMDEETRGFLEGVTDTGNRAVINYLINKNPELKIIKDDLSFRDGHPGNVYHEFWSSLFITEIQNRGI